MGAIITTYIQPSRNNRALLYLTLSLTGITALFIYKYKKTKDTLDENEQI